MSSQKLWIISFYFRYPQKKAIRPFREVPLLFLNYLQWLLLKKSLFTGEIWQGKQHMKTISFSDF